MNKVASIDQIELCKAAAIDRYYQYGIMPQLASRIVDMQIGELAKMAKIETLGKAKEFGRKALKRFNTPEGYATAGGAVAGAGIGAAADKKNRLRGAALGAVGGAGAGYGGAKGGKALVGYLAKRKQNKN